MAHKSVIWSRNWEYSDKLKAMFPRGGPYPRPKIRKNAAHYMREVIWFEYTIYLFYFITFTTFLWGGGGHCILGNYHSFLQYKIIFCIRLIFVRCVYFYRICQNRQYTVNKLLKKLYRCIRQINKNKNKNIVASKHSKLFFYRKI